MSKNEVKNNNDIVKYADDYFEINFSADLPKELESILRKNPYSEQDELDTVLSHIVILDEVKKEKNINEKNLITENVDFSISYSENGKKVTENLSVPFGMGHFSKGINHLREIGKAEYDKKQEEKKQTLLEKKTRALTKPPAKNIEDLTAEGMDTLDKAAEILNTISSPELAAFLQAFCREGQSISEALKIKSAEKKQADEEKAKLAQEQEEKEKNPKEPSKDKEEYKASKEAIEAIKDKVKEFAQSLKKSNAKSKEINQQKTLDISK